MWTIDIRKSFAIIKYLFFVNRDSNPCSLLLLSRHLTAQSRFHPILLFKILFSLPEIFSLRIFMSGVGPIISGELIGVASSTITGLILT